MTTSSETKVALTTLTDELLANLDARSKDVIQRRFGIKNGRVETLESIGKHYGVTRERVRQIEAQAKKSLANLKDLIRGVTVIFERIFHDNGGIIAQDHIVELVRAKFSGEELSASHILFYLEILPEFTYITRDTNFAPHWQSASQVNHLAVKIVQQAQTILKSAGHPIAQSELFSSIYQSIGESEAALPPAQIYAALRASKHLSLTPFKEWGLSDWAETSPRGVGDKAYAVLRRHNKPEHFTSITALINEASFDHKRANAQTVHNELIKDQRFVLVGRGLYGLAEWGYIPGTVADVLESLLKQSRRPLSREELIEQVLAQRQVKKNTILLGLQNEARFVKTAENRYTLKGNS
ncbi:MAG: sigma factor-like helix-turn-helix DNA-binding protein [Candidatus Andersenbacteria bacterium]